MLIHRVLSVIFLGPPVLLFVYYSSEIQFRWMLLLLCLVAGWEWCRLSRLEKLWQVFIYNLLLVAFTVVVFHARPEQFLSLVLIWWGIVAIWVLRYPRHETLWGNRYFTAFMGLIFISGFWYSTLYLKMHYEVLAIFYILFLVWLADSAAYFAGNAFGRRKLLPKVSPKKTWEGFYGAMVACLLYAWVCTYYWHQTYKAIISFMLLSGVCFAISVLGDLTVSMFKRHRDIKDTSQLIPGHGGLLDRLDSLLSAIPLFTLGLVWLDYKIF